MTGRHSRCDFCSSVDVQWTYPAHDVQAFEVKETILGMPIVGMSKGDWSACPVCHTLIAAEDWRGLEDRIVKTYSSYFGPHMSRSERDLVRDSVQGIIGAFRHGRYGEPKRV